MGTADMTSPRRVTRNRHAVLTATALAAPIAAQLMMFVAMMVEGRWLFAMMVVPGLVGCAASAALSSLQSQPSHGVASANGRASGTNAVLSRDAGGEAATAFARINCPAWESLGLPSPEREPLPWRHIVRVWLGEPGMDVPLGMADSGVFRLDLARQGPHALVAGTTGSGKSVLLQTWCLALACRNPPHRLNFVFLDFKGGSAFNRLARLPHVVGNVCDLDLAHATRALEALERELKRRERLVADHHASAIGQVPDEPARLVVVVDEFHALHGQLPDYVDRLVRVASLGRSLGMHLVACTQNPLGQISADMKANIAVNLCLRVRDPLQSQELLASPAAAFIRPSTPGAAYCCDGDALTPFRCAAAGDLDAVITDVRRAARFSGLRAAPPLFSAPLPAIVDDARLHGMIAKYDGHSPGPGTTADTAANTVPFGLRDDGVTLDVASLPLTHGNIAIIGPHGRGRTTLLDLVADGLRERHGYQLRRSRTTAYGTNVVTVHRCGNGVASSPDVTPPITPPPIKPASSRPTSSTASPGQPYAPPCAPPRLIWLADDADALFDPLGTDPEAPRFHDALANPGVTVIFAVRDARHVRVPEHGTTRIVFPSGDRSADLMSGIPADVLARMGPDAPRTPGRAVLLDRGSAMPVQCAVFKSVSETP